MVGRNGGSERGWGVGVGGWGVGEGWVGGRGGGCQWRELNNTEKRTTTYK